MSYLKQIKSGVIEKPYFILVYGGDGIGKTTFASQAPNPIFICSEQGTDQLDVNRLPPPKTFGEAVSMCAELVQSNHEFKTLVIDSLDWLEPLCWDEVCKEANVNSIERVDGGYGKGYVIATQRWGFLIKTLAALREKMNVILISHSHIKPFNDPQQNAAYDRYELKINAKAAALFREAVDAVLFANFEVFTKKEGQKVRAYGEGVRLLFTERRPSFDAKNRYGLPFSIALDWDEFEKAVQAGQPDSKEEILKRIEVQKTKIKEDALLNTIIDFVEKNKNNAKKLSQIENRLKVNLGDI
jgi:hypothetical protein